MFGGIDTSIWEPKAFALRQVHNYPKLILNNVDCSSTDTIHRVKFKKKYDPKAIVLSFFNSMTFAFSEITGRSYGGGVLTFEPSEIEELPIPLSQDIDLDFTELDKLVRNKMIEIVLNKLDKALLIDKFGFNKSEVATLRNIWKKLSQRRMNRNKK